MASIGKARGVSSLAQSGIRKAQHPYGDCWGGPSSAALSESLAARLVSLLSAGGGGAGASAAGATGAAGVVAAPLASPTGTVNVMPPRRAGLLAAEAASAVRVGPVAAGRAEADAIRATCALPARATRARPGVGADALAAKGEAGRAPTDRRAPADGTAVMLELLAACGAAAAVGWRTRTAAATAGACTQRLAKSDYSSVS